ncbi:accessory gland protein Acp63F-like [Drosophila teissieri]|uniref:accessory gland protein Acp63F-like n=1 Tax=Drosophila teissieri TaxID=7243 RepID=UPI001CBA3C38|nr:accessory gland protein Acp63F-like [Drosophila teissieri]
MKVLAYIFFLTMNTFETTSGKSACVGYIKPRNPYCGIAANCYYQGASLLHLGQEQCKLHELGRPAFLKFQAGKCPSDKPKCKKT